MSEPNTSIVRQFQQLRRERQGELGARADYAGATPSTFRRTRTGLYGSADAHLLSDASYFRMIEYVRDMDRNDFWTAQIVDRLADNVIRTGAVLEPKTGDKALDKAIWQDDADWANDPSKCDAAGRYT